MQAEKHKATKNVMACRQGKTHKRYSQKVPMNGRRQRQQNNQRSYYEIEKLSEQTQQLIIFRRIFIATPSSSRRKIAEKKRERERELEIERKRIKR